MLASAVKLVCSLVLLIFASRCSAQLTGDTTSAKSLDLPTAIKVIIEHSCADCHLDENREGGVQFDNLGQLPVNEKLHLLNQIQEQLLFGLMPPEDYPALTSDERDLIANWLKTQLGNLNADKLAEKLKTPDYGNLVNHEDLFSGKYADLKGFTYDRRWLISEYIFDAKFNRLLNHQPHKTIDGERKYVLGSNGRRINLTNPFLLPTNTGVRYYANTTLNGGHLLTMITNAKEAANHMIYLTGRDKRYLPAIEHIMQLEWEQTALLKSREEFLYKFIERISTDLYGVKNNSLLPPFQPVNLRQPEKPEGKEIKKSPFHAAQPGQQELALIYLTMERNKNTSDSDEQMLKRCEIEWFNLGHNERTIEARLTFLAGYLEEFRKQILQHRYEQKHKLPVYRARNDEEMTIINRSILRNRKQGDRYNDIIAKCVADWRLEFLNRLSEAGPPEIAKLEALVEQLFVKIFERTPTAIENKKYVELTKTYTSSLGNLKAIEKLIQTLILRSEFVYRDEFGSGESDKFGRQMLSPRDATYAIAYALTDSSPDQVLAEAAANGKLNTKEDYQREILRLLENRDQYYVIDEAVERLQLTASITNTPIRKLRFFRDFFGYPKMLAIFKDNKRFGSHYDNAKGRLVGEADRLVDYIIECDNHVIEELLTTEDFYVFHSGDNLAMQASSDRIKKIHDYFKNMDWQNFEADDLVVHKDFLDEVKMRGVDIDRIVSQGRRNSIREFKTAMTSFSFRFDKGQTGAAPFVSFPAHGPYNASTRTGLQLRSPEVARFYNIALDDWNYPSVQPASVPNRKGMLTHPAWLIAHAQNTETDPVQRGKWVREKLLAGTVPDIPITVDAVIPEDHHKTLRDRLVAVTENEACWKCHQRMNPVGYAFEIYDDFGRYRTQESIEHPENLIQKRPDKGGVYEDLRDLYKTLPINSQGHLTGTGDDRLDGPLEDAIDLATRLGQSRRVRQSIIRYAFRYYMGRNEQLSDSDTLINAEQAYLDNNGSFDAVIVSLLTSDSFIYRKRHEAAANDN
jgi:hypothetical protein